MTQTTTAAIAAGGKPRRKLECPAGAPQPPDPDNYYAVEPGEEHPEYFAAGPPGTREGLRGIENAISRAALLSDPKGGGGRPQVITRYRPDDEPRVVRRYVGGVSLHAVH